jgi:pimeloyl-ACP methyl ester carboxylesterase
MARYVLVHGAFGGAWCWEPVIPALEAAGHTVVAVDLPGGGEDHTLVEEITLESCAERVCAALAEPSILVGYSMGGCTPEQQAWAIPRRREQAVAPFATPVRVDDEVLARIPRSFVLTLDDNAFTTASNGE